MDESKEKVLARLREVLDEKPDAGTDELQDAAREVDPSLGSLSRRQFNAGYVLPLKRERHDPNAPRPARTKRTKARRTARRGKKAQATTGEGARGRRAASTADTGAAAADAGAERERIRHVLLRFARDLTAAESRSEIIDVLGALDGYADEVLKATRQGEGVSG